jgi:5-methylcytosine-specific restriction protein B
MLELGPVGTELGLDEIYNKTIRSLVEAEKIKPEHLEIKGAQNRPKIKRIIWSALDSLRKVDRVRNIPGKNNRASGIWVLKPNNKLSISKDEAKKILAEANILKDDDDDIVLAQDSAPAWPAHQLDAYTTNVILYGPPGTGKTFCTTARAVGLARGDVSDAMLRAEYKRLVAAGQIVFVTFHQSYGYEEFVEGIRPETTDEGQVSYDVRWGALRRIADAAQRALVVKQQPEPLWDAVCRVVDKQPGWTKTEQALTFAYAGGSSSAPATLRKDALDTGAELEALIDGGDPTTRAEALKRLKEALQERRAVPTGEIDWSATKQYVMIIDEINRGNMSRIFGELITLLEPSKRLGASDELIVRLPASGDSFGLPPNLHFIGTMNTADRSIALLDVALRRRFRFEELMPKPELVTASPNGKALMEALNKRIAILLDREHQLGHALFMRAKDDAGLVDVLQKDVLPLLKEYFYGDWERIAAVLMCSDADKSKDKSTEGALVYKETIADHGLPKNLVEQGAASMWCELSFEDAKKVAEAIVARVIGDRK